MPAPGPTARTPMLWQCGPLVLFLMAGSLLTGLAPFPARDRSEFDVLWREKVVGKVVASRQLESGTTRYRMTSSSEFDLLWKRVVLSDLQVKYTHDRLSHCTSWVKVNGALRDSSHMTVGRPGCYVHPDEKPTCAPGTQWTTARMYFEEPNGQQHIFVESLLSERPLAAAGNGRYTLSFPGGHDNTYVYKSGQLHEVHVDRGLFELVFRRK